MTSGLDTEQTYSQRKGKQKVNKKEKKQANTLQEKKLLGKHTKDRSMVN